MWFRLSSLHICHWSQSMTNVHEQWVWFTLSACIFVIDHSQWQICMNTECDLHSVACIFVIDWSLRKDDSARVGIFVIDCSQWQICMATECDLDSVACIFVIDRSQWQICIEHWVWLKPSRLHICHWPPYKELQKSLGLGICVIDQSQWQICIDYWVWFRLSRLHICHWLQSMTNMHWTLGVI